MINNTPYSTFIKTINKFKCKRTEEHSSNSKILSRKMENSKTDDLLLNSPIRVLGYSNEVGEAFRPISPMFATIMWVPALLYIGADIWDKYKRGDDDTYRNSNYKKGIEEGIFQGLASVILPTASVKLGQKIAGKTIDLFPNFKTSIVKTIQSYPRLEAIIKKFSTAKNSGYRNIGLTLAGLLSLALTVKLIDKVVDKFVQAIVHPMLNKEK